MYNIVAICGEAGSGKDTIMQALLKHFSLSLHEIISCTTRPCREGEQEGVNYYYLTDVQFQKKIEDGDMLESTKFNNWYYGTALSSLDPNKINIGVFNPEGVRKILSNPECNVLVIRVAVDAKTRLQRQLNREECPNVQEIIRRFSADEKDFANLDFNYLNILNENDMSLSSVVESIKNYINILGRSN